VELEAMEPAGVAMAVYLGAQDCVVFLMDTCQRNEIIKNYQKQEQITNSIIGGK